LKLEEGKMRALQTKLLIPAQGTALFPELRTILQTWAGQLANLG